MKFKTLALAAVCAAAASAATAHSYTLPGVQAQKDAVVACKEAFGHRGETQIVILQSSAGSLARWAPEGVSSEEIAEVNFCAEQRSREIAREIAEMPGVALCTRRDSVMIRGNIYCVGRR